jgi:hypothetical protein
MKTKYIKANYFPEMIIAFPFPHTRVPLRGIIENFKFIYTLYVWLAHGVQ